MSHQPERKEKNCLNCGATVAGRFCQVCGQENSLPKQSAWGLITHFIYDVLHFDGKFFHTLRYLFSKPGFVPKEYIAGKRMRYVDPIRMYLFTSAVFFLIFFSIKSVTQSVFRSTETSRFMTRAERLEYASILREKERTNQADSNTTRRLNFLLDTTLIITLSDTINKPANDSSFFIRLQQQDYLMNVRPVNDVVQTNNSNFVGRQVRGKWEDFRRRYGDDDRAFIKALSESIVHKFPYILFVSLPFFALVLKLLYRRQKIFYYSDHAVFTLYHYIFTFLLLLLFFGFRGLYDWSLWMVFRTMSVITLLSGGVYLFLSMKRFYGQGWRKTVVKFMLLNILAFLLLVIFGLAFILFSILQF